MLLAATTALALGFSVQYVCTCPNTHAVSTMQDAVRSAAAAMSDDDAAAAHAALLAHLRAPIRQYDGGWGDTVTRTGHKNAEKVSSSKSF